MDVEDCLSAVEFVLNIFQNEIDPDRLAIRGASAGGFTALSALVASTRFKAGVIRYGIANLETLPNDTHKFESGYLDGFVPIAERRARSPIHKMNQIKSSILFFHGEKDLVVLPSQTLRMVAELKKAHKNVECRLFKNEGHGFRRSETIMKALKQELFFYKRVFGIS